MAEVTRPGAKRLAALALLLVAFVAPTVAGRDNQTPDIPDAIAVEEGHKVAFRSYAEGVQIYRWNGATWDFVGPEAVLYDRDGEVVGIHYAGPYWESESGSRVKAAVVDRHTPDPDAIPWLLLKAVGTKGPGIFHRVTFIQRLHTTGGLMPSYAGDFAGETVGVPYTAEYVFYRAHR